GGGSLSDCAGPDVMRSGSNYSMADSLAKRESQTAVLVFIFKLTHPALFESRDQVLNFFEINFHRCLAFFARRLCAVERAGYSWAAWAGKPNSAVLLRKRVQRFAQANFPASGAYWAADTCSTSPRRARP